MKPAERLLRTVHRSMQTVAYGNPIYRKMLASGASPDRLHFTLPDSWPGDSQAGLALGVLVGFYMGCGTVQLAGVTHPYFGKELVPEPATMLLFASSALMFLTRRSRRAAAVGHTRPG